MLAGVQQEIDALVAAAKQCARSSGMTIHEAKAHFRKNGEPDRAEKLHELLCELAAQAAS